MKPVYAKLFFVPSIRKYTTGSVYIKVCLGTYPTCDQWINALLDTLKER